MKARGIQTVVRTVLVILALALPAALVPQVASAGWTWDELIFVDTADAPAATDTTPADEPVGDTGWTWDEGAAPGGEATP
jgi:hypothetical protein